MKESTQLAFRKGEKNLRKKGGRCPEAAKSGKEAILSKDRKPFTVAVPTLWRATGVKRSVGGFAMQVTVANFALASQEQLGRIYPGCCFFHENRPWVRGPKNPLGSSIRVTDLETGLQGELDSRTVVVRLIQKENCHFDVN